MLGLLRGLKAAVMLDYIFLSRRLSPESNVLALGTLLRACAAALQRDSDTAAVPLGDCVWLLRPSLLRALKPPLFVQLVGRTEARWAEEAEAEALRLACGALAQPAETFLTPPPSRRLRGCCG